MLCHGLFVYIYAFHRIVAYANFRDGEVELKWLVILRVLWKIEEESLIFNLLSFGSVNTVLSHFNA